MYTIDEINWGAIAHDWKTGGVEAALAELDRQGFQIVRKEPDVVRPYTVEEYERLLWRRMDQQWLDRVGFPPPPRDVLTRPVEDTINARLARDPEFAKAMGEEIEEENQGC